MRRYVIKFGNRGYFYSNLYDSTHRRNLVIVQDPGEACAFSDFEQANTSAQYLEWCEGQPCVVTEVVFELGLWQEA